MTISLARIDDRVIHGQTMTRWSKKYPIQGILVVSDDIANDEMRKKILKAAAADIKLGIYSVEQAKQSIPKAIASTKNFFLISDSPIWFAKLLQNGIHFGKQLNVGPIVTTGKTKNVAKNVAINDDDYIAFKTIVENDVAVYFQLIPEDEKRSWDDIDKKYLADQ